MKKFLFLIFVSFSSIASSADIYRLDPDHTNINWQVNHFGFSSPSGKFTKSEGVIILDEQKPTQSSLEITIDTNSINTGIARFDNHLKSEDFFNANLFPTAKFISTEIISLDSNSAKIHGNLTMLGITKPITLEARLNKLAINPMTQKKTAGFSAAAIIKRSDFGMTFGIPGVADNVKLNIEAEAIFSSTQNSEILTTLPDNKNITYINNPAWKIIPQESSIAFTTKQGQSTIKGHFSKFDGKINFDKNQTKGNKVEIEVDVASLNMSFADALNILKTEPWLAIQKFPKANFIAQDFTLLDNKTMKSNGKLTIKGKTSPINFTFTFTKYSNTEAVAVGSIKINRKDFNIGDSDENQAKIDEEVVIDFNIKAQR